MMWLIRSRTFTAGGGALTENCNPVRLNIQDDRLVLIITPSILMFILLFVFVEERTALLSIPALILLPFAASSLIREMRRRNVAVDLGREGPEIIAMLSVSLHSGDSLETAIRFLSEGEGGAADHFRGMLWDVETRSHASVREALASDIRFNEGTPLSLSMQLLVAASDARTPEERTEMVEEANRIMIEGMRSSLERFASSLNVPAMTVFAAGIILPLICVSLLPLMSMGQEIGMEGGYGHLAIVAMLLLPIGVGLYMRSVLMRNPLPRESSSQSGHLAMIIATLPLTAILAGLGAAPFLALGLGCSPVCLYVRWRLDGPMRRRSLMRKGEDEMGANLVRLGNHLRSGKGLEASLEASYPTNAMAKEATGRLLHSLRCTRMDASHAVLTAFSEMGYAAGIYRAVFRAAAKDVAQAGILCIRMGKNIHQRMSSKEEVVNRMRSLTDMMSATSIVFAPLVLGIGLSLATPLGQLGQGIDSSTVTLTGLYLVELAILTSWIGCRLEGIGGTMPVAHMSAGRIPVALLVFFISWSVLSGSVLG